MASKNYIKDIQMFINEAYSDKEPLQENQIKSKQVFNDYCNEISQALDRLEKLEKIFSDSHICEIKARFDEIECSAEKCENCPLSIGDGICLKKTFERKWELQKENQELIKKADCCLWKECNKISQENQELKDTNMKYAKIIDDFQAKNMRLEKAIEIIKKKNVDIEYIKTCFYDEKGGMKEYNSWVGHDEDRALTQEEYNLLKEVLGE